MNTHSCTHARGSDGLNADTQEIEKFSQSAHRWWDSASREYGALHAINPLRLEWLRSFLPIQSRRIVDVGCGGGILTESLARCGAGEVLGIDLGVESLRAARQHAQQAQIHNVQYRAVSVEELAQEAEASFDALTCMELLEHVPDAQSVVRACGRLLKTGGWAFFSTLNRNPMAFVQAIVAAEYVLKLLPRGTHEYARFIRPAELCAWAREAGLTVVALKGFTYNPLTRRYRLSANTGVNYMLAVRKER